jgi:hypothetical protein
MALKLVSLAKGMSIVVICDSVSWAKGSVTHSKTVFMSGKSETTGVGGFWDMVVGRWVVVILVVAGENDGRQED